MKADILSSFAIGKRRTTHHILIVPKPSTYDFPSSLPSPFGEGELVLRKLMELLIVSVSEIFTFFFHPPTLNAVDLDQYYLGIILGSQDSSSPGTCEAKASLPKSTILPSPPVIWRGNLSFDFWLNLKKGTD